MYHPECARTVQIINVKETFLYADVALNIPSRISSQGYKIGPVCVCVCLSVCQRISVFEKVNFRLGRCVSRCVSKIPNLSM